ncbi:MAG: dipeptidyl aminopeptidase [Burkholderiales bacterium PBB5]|nr:MAG: dipeptidyl aminopeptidase [Burkholderiales bacterium PBB5]
MGRRRTAAWNIDNRAMAGTMPWRAPAGQPAFGGVRDLPAGGRAAGCGSMAAQQRPGFTQAGSTMSKPSRTAMLRWTLLLRPLRASALAGLLASLIAQPGAAQTATAAASAPPALPAVESFYREADMSDAKLSPDGKRMAVLIPVGGRKALAVVGLEPGVKSVVAAQYTDADIHHFHWVNGERLVYDLIDFSRGGGDQKGYNGLFSVGVDGTGARMLIKTQWDGTERRPGLREPLDPQHDLLAVPGGNGSTVVVGRPSFDGARDLIEIVPMRLHVDTQRLESLGVAMPKGVTQWLFDPKGEPRVGVATKAGRATVYWRAPGESSSWQVIGEFDSNAWAFVPRQVDGTGRLFVKHGDELKLFDFAKGRPAEGALVETPGFDFSGELVYDTLAGPTAPVLGVRVTTDAETTRWLDPHMQALQQAVDKRLPNGVNRISCSRCESPDAVVLVQSWSDQDPGRYWIHRPAKNEWQLVGAMRKDIQPQRMATLDMHRFKARDGLELPVWVTLPNGPAPAAGQAPARRPAGLRVHGGPNVRGVHWTWHGEAQFLASRGYVVIEPEFRGSTGYGWKLFRAGWRQWGQAMQDDLADAMDWAVQQGWVDKDRVCIAGASYGGYAALMGPIRHPGRYRCAVAWAAVTDQQLLFGLATRSDLSEEARNYDLRELIGDPVKDAGMFNEFSPLPQAARLKAPLLLAHGREDKRVPVAHALRLRDALTKAGNPPEWVLYDDEGHGWVRPANRYDFARKMEAFLAKQLK